MLSELICVCVLYSELSSKLQDTLEMLEEQLDVALSKTCTSFDLAHYEKVQTAYRLLGKTQVFFFSQLFVYCLGFVLIKVLSKINGRKSYQCCKIS